MIWNRDKSLAETTPRDATREAGLARRKRNQQEREFEKTEQSQLSWKPAPGRRPYAGREQ